MRQANLRFVWNIIWEIAKAHVSDFSRRIEYIENISQIKRYLKGNISTVIDHLKKEMKTYSEELRFEEAQTVKEKIEILSRFRSRSTVVSNTIQKC